MSAVVYRLYDADAVCLYVGCTSNLDARLAHHATRQFWGNDIARHESVEFPTRRLALDAEAETIREHRPRYNIYGRGERSGWSQCDYAEYLDSILHYPSLDRQRRADRRELFERRVERIAGEFERRFPDTASVVLPALGLSERAS